MNSTWGAAVPRRWARVTAVVAVAVAALAGAVPVSADDIANNIDATVDSAEESISVVEGATKTVTFSVMARNEDGKNGCNLTGQTTLSVAVQSSVPGKASVSPSNLVFDSCGAQRTVSVTGLSAGTTTVSLTLTSNTSEGTFDLAPATFQVTVTRTCPSTEPAAPTLTALSAAVASGWYNASAGPAGFTLSPGDNAEYRVNGGAWTAYPSAGVTFGSDGTYSVQARNFIPAAGGCARVDGAATQATEFKVDRTAPTYGIAVAPDANAAGWNNADVSVTYSCTDAGSGIPSEECPSAETHGHSTNLAGITTTVRDVAGNSSDPATRRAIKVDTVKPTVTAVVPPYTGGTWNNEGFTVAFDCKGTGSQVVDCPPTELFAADDRYAERRVTVTDEAGNVSDPYDRRAVNLDLTAPTAVVVVSPDANPAGWNNSTVTADYSCVETGSGLAGDCPSDETFVDDGIYPAQPFSVSDVAGNDSTQDARRIVKLDTHRPSLTYRFTNLAGAEVTPRNGYFRGPVWVRFDCSDPMSGGVSSGVQESGAYACPVAYEITAEGSTPGQTFTIRDYADNESAVDVPAVRIDSTAPTLSVSVTPAPNAAGWNNTAVTVAWTCFDDGSGIDTDHAPCPAAEVVIEGDRDEQQGVTVRDLAGNVSDPVSRRAIRVDQVAPAVTVTLRDSTGAPIVTNEHDWFSQPVTVHFECGDTGGSGLVPDGVGSCPADYTQTDGEFPGHDVAVKDIAGNPGSGRVPRILIDTEAPVIEDLGPTALPESTGWYRSPVTHRFRATDDRSGFVAGGNSYTFEKDSGAAEGSGVTVASGTVTDKAGNVAPSKDSAAFKIDLGRPTNVRFLGDLADGGIFVSGAVPAAPTCMADDAVSGFARCVVSGYSTAVGTHTLIALATDNAGWTETASLGYTVRYRTSGFYNPVDMSGVVNTVKAGSTVPLKFEVFDGVTEITSTAVVSGLNGKEISCATLGALEDSIEVVATGGTSLRYDATGGQFIYNWQTTKSAGKCYATSVKLSDGSTISANFKLK